MDNVTFKQAKEAWEGLKIGIAISFSPECIQVIDKFFDQKCVWKCTDIDWEVWAGSCGDEWSFPEGNPKENEMKYCPHCGREIEVQMDKRKTNKAKRIVNALDNAIKDISKLQDGKCTWKKVDPKLHWALYNTTCSPTNPDLLKWEKTWNGKNYVDNGIFQSYKYCPFCGREIEVQE